MTLLVLRGCLRRRSTMKVPGVRVPDSPPAELRSCDELGRFDGAAGSLSTMELT